MKRVISLILVIVMLLPVLTYGNTFDPYIYGYIEGFIKGWNDGQLEIEEYDGTLHLLPMVENAIYEIDNRPASQQDFKTGMEVNAWLKGRRISHIISYSTENPGYIPEGGKVRGGIVKKIDRNQIILKLPTGVEETYFTSEATIVTRNNTMVGADTLYVGDHVRLYFDEIDTQIISRMKIEGESNIVKDVYRGRINFVNKYDDVVVLSNVMALRNGKWQLVKASMTLPFNSETTVYASGQKLNHNNIPYYRGRTVYLAIKEYFGNSRIERMVVQGQNESIYEDKIKDINWYAEAFELANNKNFTFNEGTMVVKNGRLVDRYSINPASDAIVVADGRGNRLAADVIYVLNEDLNNTPVGQKFIYSARLDQITQDRVLTKGLFNLDRNEWQAFSSQKEFFYDNDTVIYDLENRKFISGQEFYSGDYSIDENSDSHKIYGKNDWHAYFYSDGDRITNILLQKPMDSLLRQRVTNGVVEVIEDNELVGWSIYLKNGSDWSNQKSRWMMRSVPTRINLELAMVIKDGKMIEPWELKEGDRLYMVRDDFRARVVIVK